MLDVLQSYHTCRAGLAGPYQEKCAFRACPGSGFGASDTMKYEDVALSSSGFSEGTLAAAAGMEEMRFASRSDWAWRRAASLRRQTCRGEWPLYRKEHESPAKWAARHGQQQSSGQWRQARQSWMQARPDEVRGAGAAVVCPRVGKAEKGRPRKHGPHLLQPPTWARMSTRPLPLKLRTVFAIPLHDKGAKHEWVKARCGE